MAGRLTEEVKSARQRHWEQYIAIAVLNCLSDSIALSYWFFVNIAVRIVGCATS